LASSLWGSLSERVFFTRTEKQVEEDDNIKLGETFDIVDINLDNVGNTKSYKLVKLDKMYDSNYRLKPFITAFARNKTGRLALQDVDAVVRVNTDCVVFTKKQKINDASLKVDVKWTGKLNIIHTNECVAVN
jgi:hypothetical protein